MKKTRIAGGVVVNAIGQVLVVNQNGNSWSLPKGHLEAGEKPMEAAIREINEESGITQLTHVQDLGTYERHRIGRNISEEDKTELKSIDMFLFTTEQLDLSPIDPGNPEAQWVKPSDVGALLTHPKDKAFFAQVLPVVEEFIAS